MSGEILIYLLTLSVSEKLTILTWNCVTSLLFSAVNDFQIHEEARKFSYQTGVKVVVAYGGAPINQQVLIS